MAKTIDGKEIISVRTLKSMYDHDSIAAFDDNDNEYRLPVSVIMQMMQRFRFVKSQKRKYIHLIKAVRKARSV